MKLSGKILFTVLVASLCAPAAMAHTSLKTSNIIAGAAIEAAPASIDLQFGADVGLTSVSLETAAGEKLAIAYDTPKRMQKSFSVPLPSLGAGHYVFRWRTVAKDGHPMSGEIPFSIK